MKESFGISEGSKIEEVEGRLMAEFPDGILETKEDGDGFEMVLMAETGRKEAFYLQHADEEEAREIHEFAAEFIKENPGTFVDPQPLWDSVSRKRKSRGVH